MEFIDFRKQKILLMEEVRKKIQDRHPEITLKQINETLLDPIEVRESRHKNWSELYYSIAIKKNRFICVIVKLKTADNNNYIETAYTASKIKSGKVVYVKPSEVKS